MTRATAAGICLGERREQQVCPKESDGFDTQAEAAVSREHIGSFVRPDNLLNAARALKAGKIGNDELKRIADEAIVEIVRFQEDVGMPSVTDGELSSP